MSSYPKTISCGLRSLLVTLHSAHSCSIRIYARESASGDKWPARLVSGQLHEQDCENREASGQGRPSVVYSATDLDEHSHEPLLTRFAPELVPKRTIFLGLKPNCVE